MASIFPSPFVFIVVFVAIFSATVAAEHVVPAISALKQQKTTHIRFYMQDLISGPNATTVRVAKGPSSSGGGLGFGDIVVFDDKLTAGPSGSSETVGRGQGFFTDVSLGQPIFLISINFVFTAGEYNGSSVTILGRNAAFTEKVREIPIVGGTGNFRLARGYTLIQTFERNATTGNGVLQCDVNIVH